MDKASWRMELVAPFKFKVHLNLNGQPIIFIQINVHKRGCGKASAWEKIHENSFLMNSKGRLRSEVAQGD